MEIRPNSRYRFLKPTFGFRQMEEFETTSYGVLIPTESTKQVISHEILQMFLDDGRIEHIGRWKPVCDGIYFTVMSDGQVNEYRRTSSGLATFEKRHEFGNVFQSRKETESAAEIIRKTLNAITFK